MGVSPSARLRAYLSLEAGMRALDEADDPLADLLRDVMDPLWRGLSEDDHAALDARTSCGRAAGQHVSIQPDRLLCVHLALERIVVVSCGYVPYRDVNGVHQVCVELIFDPKWRPGSGEPAEAYLAEVSDLRRRLVLLDAIQSVHPHRP